MDDFIDPLPLGRWGWGKEKIEFLLLLSFLPLPVRFCKSSSEKKNVCRKVMSIREGPTAACDRQKLAGAWPRF